MTARTFGKLTVMEWAYERRGRIWLCKVICSCGTERVVRRLSLQSGRTRSCGCLRRKMQHDLHLKHGGARRGLRLVEYGTWVKMIVRCENPKDKAYPHYGGRGIAVCERWRNSFAAFLSDMGRRPGPGYSIDRIKNERGYEPGNCQWVMGPAQNRNKRNSRRITYAGLTLSLGEWSERTGVNQKTLATRHDRGWSAERMLTIPNGRGNRRTER